MDNNTYTPITKKVTIQNELGLHARPAAMLIRVTNSFSSDIIIEKGSEKVNGKSIMGVMMLAAGKGSVLTFTAKGPDSDQALKAIEEVIAGKFGEE